MATALVSSLANFPVRKDVAMTGEINLRGRVLPIGGLKDKLLAAYRGEMKTVVCPKDNEKDLHDVPKHVVKSLDIHFVSTIDEVLRLALQEVDESHPNKALHEFMKGEHAAELTDWREAREYIERRNRERKEANKTASH